MMQRGGRPQRGGRGPMGGGSMHAAMMPGDKPRSFKKTMIAFLRYLKPYRISLIVVLAFAIAGTVFSIIGPKLLGNALTKLFEGVVAKAMHLSGAAIDFSYIGNIVLVLIGLYLLSAAFNYIQGYIMAGIAMKVTYNLRKDVSEKIKRLPLKYFDTKSHGEVQSHVTNDIDTINTTLTQNLFQIVSSLTTIVGVLVMMLTISWLMTLVALAILPLSAILVGRVIKTSQGYYKKQQEYLGHMNGHVEEMYGGHIVMKAFNGEEKSIQQFDRLNKELYGSSMMSQFLSGLIMPLMSFVGNLAYVAVSILGGYLAIIGSIGVGDILAFIQYVRSFNMPITQTANIANVLQSTAAAAERVFEFLDAEEEAAEPANPVKLANPRGAVSFRNVSFGYLPDKPVINNFSADILPGQKVAIVGPTGAGKTTIVKLLMRFYDVQSGSIKVDGIDIRQFNRSDLRSMFGMVLQDTWLFNGAIRENIRYGDLNATDEQVVAAAKMAYVDHFVRTLPQSYDLEINEESSNVSQGEKQLLTIARAFLANPAILILDEATSSVDTRTEVLVQKAMKELMKERTSFVIAHRLSTIRDADMILMMKDGNIVEQGKHEQLLAANKDYAALYRSQFETVVA
ncbi:MAG TPA: multidrug ABC transporter ATP-binding protein [Dehalococcoidia bacterium]|nr:multidrug ABC transporter ATP-binding protein [Dehalococcoidia bacterium]